MSASFLPHALPFLLPSFSFVSVFLYIYSKISWVFVKCHFVLVTYFALEERPHVALICRFYQSIRVSLLHYFLYYAYVCTSCRVSNRWTSKENREEYRSVARRWNPFQRWGLNLINANRTCHTLIWVRFNGPQLLRLLLLIGYGFWWARAGSVLGHVSSWDEIIEPPRSLSSRFTVHVNHLILDL